MSDLQVGTVVDVEDLDRDQETVANDLERALTLATRHPELDSIFHMVDDIVLIARRTMAAEYDNSLSGRTNELRENIKLNRVLVELTDRLVEIMRTERKQAKLAIEGIKLRVRDAIR